MTNQLTTQQLQIGTEVFIWGRPDQDLILVFGEGTYEGQNHFNGNSYPVVKLVDGRELTVHYQGVYVGEKSSVQRTLAKYGKNIDVVEWDIQLYLEGKRPNREQRGTPRTANGVPIPPGEEAPAKTMTDKAFQLKRLIDYERAKIEAAKKMIADSERIIQDKQAEMAAIKNDVMKEFEAIGELSEEQILAAAKRIEAERATKTTTQQQAPKSDAVQIHQPGDTSVDAHHQMAIED